MRIIVFTPHYQFDKRERISTIVVNQFVDMLSSDHHVTVRRIVFDYGKFQERLRRFIWTHLPNKFGGFIPNLLSNANDIKLVGLINDRISTRFNRKFLRTVRIEGSYDLALFFFYNPGIFLYCNDNIDAKRRKLIIHELRNIWNDKEFEVIPSSDIYFRGAHIARAWRGIESNLVYSAFDNLPIVRSQLLRDIDFLIVAKFIPRKNIIETLRVIYRINALAKVTIIGKGPLKSSIEKEFSKEINMGLLNLTGFIRSREEITKYYERSKFFVLISDLEAFGLVYLEAMAFGCVIIANRDSFLCNLIDERNGFLINLDELESTLIQVSSIVDADLLKMSNSSRSLIQNFSRDRVIKQLLS